MTSFIHTNKSLFLLILPDTYLHFIDNARVAPNYVIHVYSFFWKGSFWCKFSCVGDCGLGQRITVMFVLRLDSLHQIKAVVKDEVAVPVGLAVDWVAKNLYLVDSIAKRIFVCKQDGSYLSSLIIKDLENPRGIALDPRVG